MKKTTKERTSKVSHRKALKNLDVKPTRGGTVRGGWYDPKPSTGGGTSGGGGGGGRPKV